MSTALSIFRVTSALPVYTRRARLREDYHAWTQARDMARQRMPKWDILLSLLMQATNLPVYEGITADSKAILENRSLLAEPNPAPPLLSTVAGALRNALKEARDRHLAAYDERLMDLLDNEDWKRLPRTSSERSASAAAWGRFLH